jgi:hypothetical protein
VGIPMGAILQFFALYLLPHHFIAALIITLLLVIIISYGFELYSLFSKKGHYEVLDAVASVAGGIAGMAIVLFFACSH